MVTIPHCEHSNVVNERHYKGLQVRDDIRTFSTTREEVVDEVGDGGSEACVGRGAAARLQLETFLRRRGEERECVGLGRHWRESK